jgi:hypothetical protein
LLDIEPGTIPSSPDRSSGVEKILRDHPEIDSHREDALRTVSAPDPSFEDRKCQHGIFQRLLDSLLAQDLSLSRSKLRVT